MERCRTINVSFRFWYLLTNIHNLEALTAMEVDIIVDVVQRDEV